jgi:N-terminal domain of anti-restriction factor ArdC
MAKMTRSEHEARVAEKVAAAQGVLEAEVGSLVTGEDWVRFLQFQSRLHTYSPSNVMLIHAQHAHAFADGLVSAPEPSYVAGFRTWQALGRSVDRGQHGYMVLAPIRRTRRIATDETGNSRALGRGDRVKAGEVESRSSAIRRFGVEHVFDVSQTSGTALPESPQPLLLQGEAPVGLGAAISELVEAAGYKVSTVPDARHLGGANGQTHYEARTVVIRADMDDAAMVKTLIHEAAHVLLHEGPPGRYLPRDLKEVEAESVAFVVATVHGMDTDEYSFPYVAGWAGDRGARAVTETQARVGQAAKAIIGASPADHTLGGRPLGADRVVDLNGQTHEAGREHETRATYDGPVVESPGVA